MPSNRSQKLDIMKYGRARGTYMVQKYLPNVNPFISIDLIDSIEKWERCKNDYDEYTHIRPDYPIGNKPVRLEGSDGMLTSVPKMIEEMKKQNPSSALLITRTKSKQIPRYEDDGGFAIVFDINNNVIIEFVGKGFDGRELTHGIVVHESYIIPWDKILFLKDKRSFKKYKDIKVNIIDQANYLISREKRIEFLIRRCNYDKKLLNEFIPKKYTLIADDVVKQIIDNIIMQLYLQKESLISNKMNYFYVQGNIIDSKIEPWELSTIDRLLVDDV